MTYPRDSPGFKDRGPYSTSRAAADGVASKAGTLKARVMNRLLAGPQTPEAIAEALGEHYTTIRPRLSELRATGLVVPTGETARSALGKKALLWRRCTSLETQAFLEAKEAEAS